MVGTAGEIMTRDVVCVREDTDLRDLAKLFLEKGITGAPVVNDAGDLQGVISQTDLLYYHLSRDDELKMESHFYHALRIEGHYLPKGFQIKDVNTGLVSEVMTPVVHAVTERTSLASLARLMARRRIHRVIVRKGQRVAGIVSALDVLRAISKRDAAAKKKTPSRKVKKKPARKPGRTAARKRR
jgi:CBS domain-containing protein